MGRVVWGGSSVDRSNGPNLPKHSLAPHRHRRRLRREELGARAGGGRRGGLVHRGVRFQRLHGENQRRREHPRGGGGEARGWVLGARCLVLPLVCWFCVDCRVGPLHALGAYKAPRPRSHHRRIRPMYLIFTISTDRKDRPGNSVSQLSNLWSNIKQGWSASCTSRRWRTTCRSSSSAGTSTGSSARRRPCSRSEE